MRNKKSSLSLSINAIVILILAITMLGLGLTFMRGLFKQATERVESAVSAQELTNPPTIDNPMTMAPGKVTLRTKDVGKALIAFMNTGVENFCALGVYETGVTPIAPITPDANAKIIYNDGATSAAMTIDQINTWTLSIIGSKGNATETSIFTAIMCCDGTKATKELLFPTATPQVCVGSSQFKKDLVVTYTS